MQWGQLEFVLGPHMLHARQRSDLLKQAVSSAGSENAGSLHHAFDVEPQRLKLEYHVVD